MDNLSRLRFLFAKYLQRQCTAGEVEEMVFLLQRADAEDALSEEMELLWEEVRKDKTQYDADWSKIYSTVINKGKYTNEIINRATNMPWWPYYTIIAIFLFLILMITYWFIHNPASGNNAQFVFGGFKTKRCYYLNNTGNDTNDGSKINPWKTINKLNSIQFQPGDTIYFEGQQLFTGNILIDSADAGSSTNPVVITSCGNGKAIINGENATALTVYQAKFITINNLQFQGAGRKTGNTKDGVIINKSNNIIADNLIIKGFQKSGLLVNSSSDIEVKKIYAAENGTAGILAIGEWGKRDCSNIHISYCTAENNPGDPTNFTNHSGNGILAGLCKNVTIEYCTATNNGWDMPRKGNGPVGIWCYEADSVIIQYCISYKNKTAPGAADGGGFDLDGGVTNSVIQYCLSYENEGSGYGIFQYAGASKWYNNTIRYCISENDGAVSAAHAGVFIWNSSRDTSQFKNCYFYNNTVYNERGATISYEPQSENAGFRFYNNIFVGKDSLILGKETNSTYLGNDWFSLADSFNIKGVKNFSAWVTANNKEIYKGTTVGFNIRPLFTNPGKASFVLPSQLYQFENYKIPGNSPLKNGGLDLKQLFGIETGGKSFNTTVAPPKGIGASF